MVRPEDAEEYELASRRSDESEHGHAETAGLLAGEPKASTELDDDDAVRLTRELDEEEVTGQGGKIEALIARVSVVLA
jgi:hypothetical protein